MVVGSVVAGEAEVRKKRRNLDHGIVAAGALWLATQSFGFVPLSHWLQLECPPAPSDAEALARAAVPPEQDEVPPLGPADVTEGPE